MERPQVIQIQAQTVETTEREIQDWEAEEILRKYGHNQNFSSIDNIAPSIEEDTNLTFEEMIRQQHEKERLEKLKRDQQLYGAKPITFDPSNGYDTETKWGSDDELGFGFKIEITSDMKIPKY